MSSKRNGEIDLLRFVFAVIVLVFHFNDCYYLNIFKNGNIGVEFFFVLSGFLMARQVQRYNDESLDGNQIANITWRLTAKKVAPIYTYYFSAVIIQIIVRNIVISGISFFELCEGLAKSIPTFTLSFLGLMRNDITSFYVGNTWYLSALLIASLILYPILIKKKGFALKIICPLIAMFGISYLYATYGRITMWQNWNGVLYVGIIRAFCEMALGAFLLPVSKMLVTKLPTLFTSDKPLPKIFLTVVKWLAYATVIFYVAAPFVSKAFSLHALLFVSLGIMLSFTNAGYCIKDCKFTKYLGRISLPIFIFHGVIRWTVSDVIPKSAVNVPVFIAMCVGAIIMSIILMYVIDFIGKGIKKIFGKLKKYC